MVFSDLDFLIVFLPTLLAAFWLTRALRPGPLLVVVALTGSALFYSAWSPRFLLLVVASVSVNYALGQLLAFRRESRRTILAVGVTFNLLLLAFFKYSRFVVETLAAILPLDLGPLLSLSASVVLPLGISFFTFQQIAYLVDTSRNPPAAAPKSEPFINYALFVFLFPHLIAGPIVRHSEISRQIARLGQEPFGDLQRFGAMIFSVGLAKKVLIADPLSPLVGKCFAAPATLDVASAWAGLTGYTLQLYFDFSGYSDMAVGLAAMLGIAFPMNFDRPYLSASIREFWRRWHITLSRFLRDYLYIPLGGNRGDTAQVCSRIIITMLLGGLWHGAGWTFVLWGAYHGIMLAAHRLWTTAGLRMPRVAGWAVTVLVVMLGWVLFRAASLADAIDYYAALFGLNDVAGRVVGRADLPAAFWIGLCSVLLWNERLPAQGRFAPLGAVASGVLIWLSLTDGGKFSEFLYFQF